MKILDLSAGNRAIWAEVKPDIVCDTRSLPAEVGTGFDLVVFDPIHVNCGENSNMAKVYGHSTTEEIVDTVASSAKEAHRVSNPKRADGIQMEHTRHSACLYSEPDERQGTIIRALDQKWSLREITDLLGNAKKEDK